MSVKVYNQLILKGNVDSLIKLLKGCYGNPLLDELDAVGKEVCPTFNSYIKINEENIDRNEIYNKWGTSVDSLRDYISSFENAFDKLENYKDKDEYEIKISFETYNGFVFSWVKELAKSNFNVNIKYFVVDKINDFYSSCIFDINTNNTKYATERYVSNAELRYKFLGVPLKDIINSEIDYAKLMLDVDNDKEFNVNSIKDYLKSEFSFLDKEEFELLLCK